VSNLSIKDVPEPWAEALRQRALRHHRSLQGELLAMVEAVVKAESQVANNPAWPNGESTSGPRRGTKTVEAIALEVKMKFPALAINAPLSVAIIRAERDAR
jgi:antitoxin FitA